MYPLDRFVRLLSFACLLLIATVLADPPAALRLGIMPFNSTLALIKTHQPLAQHLEKALGRPVVIHTSADYFTFVNELLDNQFDIAIAGPHFGSMAIARGAIPLVRYRATLQPVFVVQARAPIKQLDELRGKRIGLSSRLSISSIGGVKWLHDNGLKLDVDFQLIERSTHGAAIAGVAVGDFDAALTTHTPLKQIPPDIREQIRILPLDIQVPHLMTIAQARLGKPLIQEIRTALKRFPDTPEGKSFFKDTGYQGYDEITASDLKALEPFVELTVQMMRTRQ